MSKWELFTKLINLTDNYQLREIVDFIECFSSCDEEVIEEQISKKHREHKHLGGWLNG